MIIKVSDPSIGTFTWKVPKALAEKWALIFAEATGDEEKRILELIKENITGLLMVTCDAMEFTIITPALFRAMDINIGQLMEDANNIIMMADDMDEILENEEKNESEEDEDLKEIDDFLKENKDLDEKPDDDNPDKKD